MVEKPLINSAPEKKTNGFKSDHNAKSLKEFQKYVQVPQKQGVVGSVVDSINRRIGVGPLDIESISSELNLSKRTLQRHLRKNGSSFMELRDKVRFRHAMACLLEKHMTIESTADYLNFSDRTSFTNAFKHWSGHSPSSFRKMYRDVN